jgi:ATP-dependent protease ClpP protease subunit
MKNSFKYIKNVSSEEGTILLYNQIGDSIDANGNLTQGINGASFAYEMQYLQDNCKKINVRINSIGGSVLDGYSIISAILNSKVPCDTYVDGLAASISGVIAMCGKKRTIKDFASWMGHEADGVSNEKVLQLATDSIITMIANNINKTEDEVSVMLKKETWISNSRVADFSLEQSVEMGFFDKIESTKRKIKVQTTNSLSDMALIYNKIINPKNNKMEKVINLLKLKNEATEMDIIDAIENKDTVNAELVAENDELKARLKVIEDKENEAKETALNDLKDKATVMVEKAITEKKIEESEKESTIEMAVNNFSFVENMLNKITNVKNAVKVFDIKNVVVSKGTEDRSEWSIRDWEKKDAKGLAEIKKSTPALYTEMYNKHYNK